MLTCLEVFVEIKRIIIAVKLIKMAAIIEWKICKGNKV